MRTDFSHLYRSNLSSIRRIVRSRIRHPDEVEDVVQSAFTRAFRAYGRFRGAAAFSTWLTRIALNECSSNLSRRLRRAEMEEAYAERSILDRRPPSPLDEVERADLHERVRAAIQELPDPYRQVIRRHYLDSVPYVDLAREMAVPMGTVKAWLHRGRRRLRSELELLQ